VAVAVALALATVATMGGVEWSGVAGLVQHRHVACHKIINTLIELLTDTHRAQEHKHKQHATASGTTIETPGGQRANVVHRSKGACD